MEIKAYRRVLIVIETRADTAESGTILEICCVGDVRCNAKSRSSKNVTNAVGVRERVQYCNTVRIDVLASSITRFDLSNVIDKVRK